jgi:peptidoglycan/xylan/chitin deacetylase (PgdA/CDA1 family)
MREALGKEIAHLVAAHRADRATFTPIGPIAWPDGYRIAVNFTADFDAMLLRRLNNEPAEQLAKGEFGGRVGIWRLIELFDTHRVKATFFVPGRICELYPRAVKACAASGHEVADHMWEHQVPKDGQLERDHLNKSTQSLCELTGTRPVGTRSWHTAAALVEQHYIYRSHGSDAHGPTWSHDGSGKNRLVELPFHYAIDDAMYFSFAWYKSTTGEQRLFDPDRVMALWWAAFERQYRSGGYLNICLHPFVSGRALRIAMLDRLITRMKRLPGVWFSSCEDVARHVIATCPAPASRA